MFNKTKLSEGASRILTEAEKLAVKRKQNRIHPIHLLAVMSELPYECANFSKRFRALIPISNDRWDTIIEKKVKEIRSTEATTSTAPLSKESRLILENADQISDRNGFKEIEPEHILSQFLYECIPGFSIQDLVEEANKLGPSEISRQDSPGA